MTNQFSKFVFFVAISIAITACSNNNQQENQKMRGGMPASDATAVTEAAPAPPPVYEESTEKGVFANATASGTVTTLTGNASASEPNMPTARKFMRAAEMQYRTKNVEKTTELVENWTRQYGGFVLLSALSTSIDNTNTSPVGSDSLLENTVYTIHNTMTLRVPNQYFDTLLNKINGTVDFLELRKLSADDVSLTMLGNKIQTANTRTTAQRLRNAIDRSSKKLGEMTEAERIALETQNSADEAAMRNLHLQDRVDFCTVEARIYQRPIVQQRTILNLNKYIDYSPPFFLRVWEAISGGWHAIQEMIVALMHLWFFLPLGFGGWWLFKKLRNK
jgi:Domain of unknown function (DUF4349)